MVRPVRFRMNEETVVNNYFQEEMDLKNEEINRQAQQEFDALVHKLRIVGVKYPVRLLNFRHPRGSGGYGSSYKGGFLSVETLLQERATSAV